MVITSQRPLLEKEQKRLITLVNFQRSSALKSGQFSMPSNMELPARVGGHCLG